MKKEKINNKIIVILGPTACGKTGLGIKLALKYNGEIISADSRQVYKYMDIGTGKDLREYKVKIGSGAPWRGAIHGDTKYTKIPYHLINMVDPKTKYDLVKYKRDALKAIDDVLRRGKLPFIVGGTGLYLQALVDDYQLSQIKPNEKLRNELEKLNTKQLFQKLSKLNNGFATKLNQSERGNKRRLIRYIEIESTGVGGGSGAPWRAYSRTAALQCGGTDVSQCASTKKYNFLLIGVKYPKQIIWDRIYKRLIERLEKEKMVAEVKRLHEKYKVSWRRLIGFGLEYKFISEHLLGQLTYDEMVERLFIAIRQFSKRQMTWFRRWEKHGAKIKWVKSVIGADREVRIFLKK